MIRYAAPFMYLFLFLLSLLSTNNLTFGCGQNLVHQYTREGSDVLLNFTLDVSSLELHVFHTYFVDLINKTTLFTFNYLGNKTSYVSNATNVMFIGDWLTGNITFTVRNITSKTSGVYGIREQEDYIQCITVFILDGPGNVFLQPDRTNYIVNEGDVIPNITCTSSCFPSCLFTWKWEEKLIAFQESNATLHIGNNITRRHAGVYTCEVKNTQNPSMVETAQVILNVIYGPDAALVQPTQQNYTINEGDTISDIICNSDCFPGCIYFWIKDQMLIGRANNGTLHLGNNITREFAGVYTCAIRNTANNATIESANITLVVIYGPDTAFLNPIHQNYIINEGDGIHDVTCFSDCYPICTVTWRKDNQTYITPNQMNSSLQLGNNITRALAGVYTCQVQNAESLLVKIAKITLNVRWRPSLPIIRTVTSSFPWLEGQTGILNCTADDMGNPPSKVIWATDNGTTNPLGQLVFDRLTYQHDQKHVICQLQNNFTSSKGEIVVSNITLNVQYKPHITIKRDNDEVNNLTVVEGATVEIMCSGIGNPQPSISWYGTSKTSSEGNLTFTNTDRSQAGNYLCVATAISESYPSFSFSTNKSVSVIVFYPPDVIIQQSGGVIQNQTLELSCLAKGEPNVYNYQKWEHNWRGTDINSFNLQRQGPLIIIFSLQLQNSGNYTCSVDNGIKNRMGELLQHATVELLVKVSPIFFADELMVNGTFSKNTTVSVPFYSYPPSAKINVKSKNRTLIQSSSKYMVFIEETIIKTVFYATAVNLNGHLIHFTILNLQESDFDNYRIMVTNAVGSKEWSFSVVSRSIPNPPTDFKLIEVSGRTASFIWTRGFNGGQKQTFVLQLSDKGLTNWTDKILVEEDDDYSNLGNRSYRANITDLKPGSYAVKLLAFNGYGMSKPLVLSTFIEIYSPAKDEPRESQQGAVAGGAVGGTLAAILVICIVLFVLRRYTGYPVCKFMFRRNKSAGNSIKEDYENMSVTTSSLSVCAVNSPETVDDRSGNKQYERLRSKKQSSTPYEDLHYPNQFNALKSDDQGFTTTQSNPSSKHDYYNMQGGKSAEQPRQHIKSGPEHVQYANIRGVRKGKKVSKTNAQDRQEDKPTATVIYSNLKMLSD